MFFPSSPGDGHGPPTQWFVVSPEPKLYPRAAPEPISLPPGNLTMRLAENLLLGKQQEWFNLELKGAASPPERWRPLRRGRKEGENLVVGPVTGNHTSLSPSSTTQKVLNPCLNAGTRSQADNGDLSPD